MNVTLKSYVIASILFLLFSCAGHSEKIFYTAKDEGRVKTQNGSSKKTPSWELSSIESSRFEELKLGPRGLQSPNLDPITTLGIEARNDAERRHYAKLWVKQEYERTEKELKFQREVDAAWKRLMPNMLPVNMGNAAGIAHDSGGRLALFVRGADCQRCDAQQSNILTDELHDVI